MGSNTSNSALENCIVTPASPLRGTRRFTAYVVGIDADGVVLSRTRSAKRGESYVIKDDLHTLKATRAGVQTINVADFEAGDRVYVVTQGNEVSVIADRGEGASQFSKLLRHIRSL